MGICRDVFTRVLDDQPHQVSRLRNDVHVDARTLLDVSSAGGHCTIAGLRNESAWR